MRALKLIAVSGAGILLLALLAAWQAPPRMDWNRYRGELAAFASARMGRQVSIGGQVRLLLLPDAVLVADRVKLADRGDGVSATIGALRLRIAFGPLLRGRIVPRRLELDDPVVTLPWPLPRGTAQAVPAGVAGGFTASVEGGSLRLGGVVLAGINAGVRTDPDTGAFAAQGAARLGGLPCRFTALIGAPGGDGASLLTVTVDGQDSAQGLGGTLRGHVQADGVVQGVLAVRGPDLSRLVPGPALPWRLQGEVSADQERMAAPRLALMLGQSPGDGSATLHLGAAPSLDVAAALGQAPLDGWWGAVVGAPAPALPVHVAVSAAASALLGGTVRDGHAELWLDKGGSRLRAQGVLPGNTVLHLEGGAQGGGGFAGSFALATQDAPLLAAWLRPVAPAVVDALPAPPGQADFKGMVRVGPGEAALSGLSGHVGGSAVSGSVTLDTGKRPSVTAVLAVDRVAMPAGPDWGGWAAVRRLPALAAAFGGFDANFDFSAATLAWGDRVLSRVAVQGRGSAGGVSLSRVQADLPGAHVEASGAVAPDGGVADARLDLASADASALKMPFWLPAGLWKGPLHVAVSAGGPAHAIAGQLRGDLGDLRAEADAVLDTQAPLLTATVTLRHPGAPRLAELAGLAGAGAWLGQGSVALAAHMTAAPGQIAANDFSVAAGALRVGGQLGADLSGRFAVVTGRIDAPVLTLPPLRVGPDTALPLWVLQGWQGQIQLSAAQILAGLWPLAANSSATLSVAFGDALLDGVDIGVAGGRFTGQAAVDAAVALPLFAVRGSLTRAAVDQLPALPGLVFQGGVLDVAGALDAGGHSPAALLATLSGTAHGTLTGASLQGVDLPALTRLLAARGPRLRTALPAALASGQTGPLAGGFDATVDNGALSITAATLTGVAGSVAMSGGIDLPERSADLKMRVLPGVAEPPGLTVHVAGGSGWWGRRLGWFGRGGGGLRGGLGVWGGVPAHLASEEFLGGWGCVGERPLTWPLPHEGWG